MSLPIELETTIGAVLEAYPEVEDTLLSCAPGLAKLANPVLRRTVARLTTLEQAATLGGIPAAELVRKLRGAAGQSAPVAQADARPVWVSEELVRHQIDADSMLARGEHPIGPIKQWFSALPPGGIIRLTSSFRPAPLIDTMRRSGALVHAEEAGPGAHVIYISRA